MSLLSREMQEEKRKICLMKHKQLMTYYSNLLDKANDMQIARFSFVFEDINYLVEWRNGVWSDPMPLYVFK